MSLQQFRWKLFLILGGGFGVFTGALTAFQDDVAAGIGRGIIGGLFFGVIMTLFLSRRQASAIKKAGWTDDKVFNVVQDGAVDLPMPPDEAFGQVEHAVLQLPSRIVTANPEAGEITARVPMSWNSWGEVLQVRIESTPAGSIARISSRPRMRLTVADFGKNRTNVERIAAALLSGSPA
ncbi:DUF1499 domain-containing protein [Smaragdicoccus niigatensis]|uniref:DUF1499 domain-containing protein n=1 Tax=Smaragdicoccus niigatensis TaxID=359359 RepID=UPI000376C89E|nr:DUF1499 domain-containing protein [Smaragdicoccus niigatensis]